MVEEESATSKESHKEALKTLGGIVPLREGTWHDRDHRREGGAQMSVEMSISNWIQTAAIVLGGLYALYEYRRVRRFSPKIQFELDFDLYPIDRRSGVHLLDVDLTVRNQGQVRMYLPEIFVGVKTLGADDVDESLSKQGRLKFTRALVPKKNIVHDPKDPWWVDAGVTQRFPLPVAVRDPGDFIQVNAEFRYYKNIKKYKAIVAKEDRMRDGIAGTKEEEERVAKEKERIREGYHKASVVKPRRT
jgi:hypothetical protein